MNTKTLMRLNTTLFVLLLIFSSCSDSVKKESTDKVDPAIVNNPATADPSASLDENAVPVIEFETTRHHFGVIESGEKVSHSFKFINSGNAPLVISSAKATCGCTVPSYTKEPIQPGEKGSIEVTFDSSGKSGMESKNVTIISNASPNTTVLTISAEILKTKEPTN